MRENVLGEKAEGLKGGCKLDVQNDCEYMGINLGKGLKGNKQKVVGKRLQSINTGKKEGGEMRTGKREGGGVSGPVTVLISICPGGT